MFRTQKRAIERRSRTARRAKTRIGARTQWKRADAERFLLCIERGRQQHDGAAKQAQTPLRALACFVPALLHEHTRAWFRAIMQLLSIGTPYRISAPAQPAHAADRFAREIVGILTVIVMRSRRLMGKAFGAFIPKAF